MKPDSHYFKGYFADSPSSTHKLDTTGKRGNPFRQIVPLNLDQSDFSTPTQKIHKNHRKNMSVVQPFNFDNLEDEIIKAGDGIDSSHKIVKKLSKSFDQINEADDAPKSKHPLKQWKKLGNVVRSLRRFQTNQVKNIDHPQELEVELGQYNMYTSPRLHLATTDGFQNTRIFDACLRDMRQIEAFTTYAQNGSLKDIKEMQKIIQNDKKQFLRSPDDPSNIINRHNKYSLNAFYLACRNGNLNVVKFLLAVKANAHIASCPGRGQLETPLEVAVRWNHRPCVEELLEHISYSDDLLKKIMSWCNGEMKTLLRGKLKQKKYCCCFL